MLVLIRAFGIHLNFVSALPIRLETSSLKAVQAFKNRRDET